MAIYIPIDKLIDILGHPLTPAIGCLTSLLLCNLGFLWRFTKAFFYEHLSGEKRHTLTNLLLAWVGTGNLAKYTWQEWYESNLSAPCLASISTIAAITLCYSWIIVLFNVIKSPKPKVPQHP